MIRKLFFFISLIFISINFFSCQSQKNGQTIAYVNGHVITLDENNPEVEAFVVENGTIISVGLTDELCKSFPNTQVVDLKGKHVMPGIIESHGHLLTLGQSFLELNIEGIETPEEAVKKVEEKVKDLSPGEWLIGWGWDDGAWASNYPTNEQLNKISPNNPIYLRGLHGFASWVNDKVLEVTGINANTPNPENGKILKDIQTGKPTGILTNKAQDLVEKHIPPFTLSQCEKALKLAIDECLRNGLTTIHEAKTSSMMLQAFRSLLKKNELNARIYVMLDVTDKKLIKSFLNNGPEIDPNHMLDIRGIKVFVDGALGSRGAAMLEPYSDDPNVKGVIVTSEDSLYNITVQSLKCGFQVITHGIGDYANRIILNAYKRAIEDVPTAEDHRLRLEHAQVTAVSDITKFAPFDIVLSMQPPHATSDMPWAETRVGPERIKGAYAWRLFLDSGVHLALNSDFPGETLNPFHGMYAAETRQTADGKPEGGWYPEQCLTREEALKGYTFESAYSGFEEKFLGRIAPGMCADFIIISDDILTISSKELLSLEVEETYVGGRLVYKK